MVLLGSSWVGRDLNSWPGCVVSCQLVLAVGWSGARVSCTWPLALGPAPGLKRERPALPGSVTALEVTAPLLHSVGRRQVVRRVRGMGVRAEGLAGASGGQRHLSHLAGPHAPVTLPRSRRQLLLAPPPPALTESSASLLPVRTLHSRLREGCRTHPQNALLSPRPLLETLLGSLLSTDTLSPPEASCPVLAPHAL